jgi:hypothetical protein
LAFEAIFVRIADEPSNAAPQNVEAMKGHATRCRA